MTEMTSQPRTMFDKLWASHEIAQRDGESLLWIDRHYIHEGAFQGFTQIDARGATVAEPSLTFGVADHYVPTRRGAGSPIADPAIAAMVDQFDHNMIKHGIRAFDLADKRQGIVHVVGPELGLTLPGLLVVCGDSHTSTHGALGAFAFGIGASEVAHVLMSQTLWQKKPKSMRITVEGKAAESFGAKDMALSVISTIGANGASGHVIEFAGPAIRALSMEARLTLCNMAIEAGGRCAMIAPDETTFAYIKGREFAPKGEAFDAAVAEWREIKTDDGAVFDREVTIDASSLAPIVTWGTSPEDALPIDGIVPDPANEQNPERASYLKGALDYMGLTAGEKLTDIAIDRVFIGSCTNARIEDLRAAAAVLNGRTSKVPGMVSPGSSTVKRQAEEEGLDAVFRAAGLEWVDSGCSMCVGINGDTVPSGERCASTTNRNFRGRQGIGARTHIMSPAMVAAAAVSGHLADMRALPATEKV